MRLSQGSNAVGLKRNPMEAREHNGSQVSTPTATVKFVVEACLGGKHVRRSETRAHRLNSAKNGTLEDKFSV